MNFRVLFYTILTVTFFNFLSGLYDVKRLITLVNALYSLFRVDRAWKFPQIPKIC